VDKGHKAAADKIVVALRRGGEEGDKMGPNHGYFPLCVPPSCRSRPGRWRPNGASLMSATYIF